MRVTAGVNPFRRTLIIFGVTVASALVSFFVVGWQLLAPARGTVDEPEDGMAMEAVTIAGRGDTKLAGWVAGRADAAAVVVLMHAALADRRSMLGRARFLAQAGYAVLLFDFQAHGESAGRRLTYGLRESQNVLDAVAYAKDRYPGVPVVTLGVELGGGAGLLAGPALEVDGMILESVFPDLASAIANRLQLRLGRLGVYLAPLFAGQLEWRLDAPGEDFWTYARAPAVEAPVMVIAAAADRRVTAAQTLRYYELFASTKSIWLVGGAVHQDLHWYAGMEYERRVLKFVAYVVARAAQR